MMSYLLIEGLRFIKEVAERNHDGKFSIDEIASNLKVSPKTVRHYIDDFVDTDFVETISVNGKEYLKALPRFLKGNCGLMKYK